MITATLFAVAMLAADAAPKKVQCTGTGKITVGTMSSAPTPFDAVFLLDGDTVRMVEGDKMRFAESYERSAELEAKTPERQAFTSEHGNLFLYRESDRFEIYHLDLVRAGMKVVEVAGRCAKFEPKNVFD